MEPYLPALNLLHVHPLFGSWNNVGECLQRLQIAPEKEVPQLTGSTSFGESVTGDAPHSGVAVDPDIHSLACGL